MRFPSRKEIMAIVYNQSIGTETTYKYFLLVKLSIPLNVRIIAIFFSSPSLLVPLGTRRITRKTLVYFKNTYCSACIHSFLSSSVVADMRYDVCLPSTTLPSPCVLAALITLLFVVTSSKHCYKGKNKRSRKHNS